MKVDNISLVLQKVAAKPKKCGHPWCRRYCSNTYLDFYSTTPSPGQSKTVTVALTTFSGVAVSLVQFLHVYTGNTYK